MTKREFLNAVSNDGEDVLQRVLNLLETEKTGYCVIGGLAVNAYVEPVVSLDLDIVVVSSGIESFIKEVQKNFVLEKFAHSYNISRSTSDLRIQIQTDPRYQAFISRASIKEVMGYKMNIASLEDVLQGKIWAYSDKLRRKSKQQKDLADIYRLIETYPQLKEKLPESIKENL